MSRDVNERAHPSTDSRPQPDRREFLTVGVGLLFVATVPVLGRLRGSGLIRRTAPVMGTTAEIVVAHHDRAQGLHAIDRALAELQWVERTMTRFRSDSDVGRANAFASTDPVAIDAATTSVLMEARLWAERTAGRFDPCLGRVSALWNVGERTEPLPPVRYQRFCGAGLYRDLEVEETTEGGIVHFASKDVGLDLGGIAKGFGVDRAVAALREHGVRDALVSVGGDLYAMGHRPDGEPWRVGVRHPDDPNSIAVTLDASDQAIATSGDYEQYFDHGGRRYHHILDSATAEPVDGPWRSLTMGAWSCMTADAAATALFGVGPTQLSAEVRGLLGAGVDVLHSISV